MIEWRISPGPVRTTSVAHARERNRSISYCEKIKDLDKGVLATDADTKCPSCKEAIERDFMERLGAKPKPRHGTAWETDDNLRTGAMKAVLVKIKRRRVCAWSIPKHYVRPGSAMRIDIYGDTDFVCLNCWDKERIAVLK